MAIMTRRLTLPGVVGSWPAGVGALLFGATVRVPVPPVMAGHVPNRAWIPVPQLARYRAQVSVLLAPLMITACVMTLGAAVAPDADWAALVGGAAAVMSLALMLRWQAVARMARRLNAQAAARHRRGGRHAAAAVSRGAPRPADAGSQPPAPRVGGRHRRRDDLTDQNGNDGSRTGRSPVPFSRPSLAR
jgi:hypothetical protein